jgi:hypothetical protein
LRQQVVPEELADGGCNRGLVVCTLLLRNRLIPFLLRLRIRGERPVPFARGSVSLLDHLPLGSDSDSLRFPSAQGLPRAHDGSRGECHEHGRHAADQRFMPPGKLVKLIDGVGGPSRDRLIGQIPADIRREGRRRCISPRLVFLQGLGDDRLYIASVDAADRAESSRIFLLDGARGLDQLAAQSIRQARGK